MNRNVINIVNVLQVFALVMLVSLGLFTVHTQINGVASSIIIDSHGVVNVTIVLELSEGLNKVSLPVDPIPITITAVGDDEDLPLIYDEGTLYLYLDKPVKVTVNYIANVTVENNMFIFDITTPDVVELRISKNVVLLSWPDENIIDVGYVHGMLTLRIRGPTTIRYTVKVPLTETTPVPQQTTPTVSPTTLPQQTPTQIPTPQQTSTTQTSTFELTTEGGSPLVWIAIVASGLLISGVGYLVISRRRDLRKRSIIDMLSDVDIAIIRTLEALGGSVLQTELQNHVKIPRTTLWRHVKKLEKLGVVKVEKIGLQNRITLTKKIKLD